MKLASIATTQLTPDGRQIASEYCFDRYMATVNWARRRYTRNGLVVVSIGGKNAPYRAIELAAARRYLGV